MLLLVSGLQLPFLFCGFSLGSSPQLGFLVVFVTFAGELLCAEFPPPAPAFFSGSFLGCVVFWVSRGRSEKQSQQSYEKELSCPVAAPTSHDLLSASWGPAGLRRGVKAERPETRVWVPVRA